MIYLDFVYQQDGKIHYFLEENERDNFTFWAWSDSDAIESGNYDDFTTMRGISPSTPLSEIYKNYGNSILKQYDYSEDILYDILKDSDNEDFIICCDILEHLSEIDAYVEQMRKQLLAYMKGSDGIDLK